MNNFVIGLKRFFTNKNVVTILLVLVALVLLFIGYDSAIKSQTQPVRVPVAAKLIAPRTEITAGDIKYINVAKSILSEDVITVPKQIIGYYTNLNASIPEGSMFYKTWIVEKNKIPGSWIEEVVKGEEAYYMSTNVEKTLGNNVIPGSYIDIYMKAYDETGTVMFGRLLENIKIIVVHDGSGKNVFESSEGTRSPSKLGFSVNKDLYILLNKAKELRIELIIAPQGTVPPEVEGVNVKSSVLRDYIDAQTITVEEDVVIETNPETQTNNNGTETPIVE